MRDEDGNKIVFGKELLLYNIHEAYPEYCEKNPDNKVELTRFFFLFIQALFCCNCQINTCQLSRITPVDSQVLTVYHGHEPVNITLDSGATASFITSNRILLLEHIKPSLLSDDEENEC